MKKIAIIHIGAPKTGTTSIQIFCYKNRRILLNKYGIYYPEHKQLIRPESGYGHHYLAFHLFKDDPICSRITPEYIDLDNTFEYLKEGIRNRKHKILLLSCERLINSILSNRFDKFLSILKETYDSINIILFIRKQDDIILSMYGTRILMGLYQSLDDFIQESLNRFDFYSLIKKYENKGIKVNLCVYKKEENSVQNFLDIVSKIIEKKIIIGDTMVYENKSLPWFVIQIMADLLKEKLPKENFLALRNLGYLLIKNQNIPANYKYLAPPSLRQKILKAFENSNRKLSSEYLGLVNKLWYEENEDQLTDEDWEKEYKNRAIMHLCNSILGGK
uniref:Sulfotransferase domain-containing protein n=1 Tax=Thermodesulfobacterium geofontis TaxID=1295609 RepID=A0A7V6CD49_9BACT